MNETTYHNPDAALNAIARSNKSCTAVLQASVEGLFDTAHDIWKDPQQAVEALRRQLPHMGPRTLLTYVAIKPERFGELVTKRRHVLWTTTEAARDAARQPYMMLGEAVLNEMESIGTTLANHVNGGKQTYGDAGTGAYLPTGDYHVGMLSKLPGMPPEASALITRIVDDN